APLAWSWAVAATALWLLGYLTQAYLKWNPPYPKGKPNLYFIDQLFLLSVTGEAKHHFPPQLPQVAGEPLTYHWFAFAHMATASQISGVDTPQVFFRLAPPAMCLLAVLLLAVVGWRVSGKPWVGAVAAALTFAVGELVVGSFDTGPLGSSTGFVIWNSQSVPYVWLLTFPLILLAADRLAGGLPDAPVGRGAWASYAVYMLPRLAGIAVLPRPGGRLEWFLLGGAAGAVGLTLLLWHPALGQNYFVRTGWAFGAVLSAMGVVSYVERRRVPAR